MRFLLVGLLTVLNPPALAAEGARLVPQVGHTQPVRQVALSPDGRHLATASRDGSVGLWDVQTSAMLRRFVAPEGAMIAVGFADDGRVTGASSAGDWLIWPIDGGAPELLVDTDADWRTAQLVGGRLLAADRQGGAALWTSKSKRGGTLSGVEWTGPQAASSDGRWVAAHLGDRQIGVFKGRSGKLAHTLTVTGERLGAVAMSPDGTRVVATDDTREATVWSARTGERLATLVLDDETRRHVDAGFAPDGTVVTRDERSTFYAWSGSKVTATVETGGYLAPGLQVLGSLVAAPDFDGGVGLWSLADGERVAAMFGTVREPTVLTASLQGQLAVGHLDGTATVWDPRSGGAPRTWAIGESAVRTLSLHQRGLLLGTTDREVTLYNVHFGSQPLFWLERTGATLRGAALDFLGREVYVADAFRAEGWRVDPFRSAPFVRTRIDGGWVRANGDALGEVPRMRVDQGLRATLPRWVSPSEHGVDVVDEETGAVRGSLYAFQDGSWAVVDAEGRFDTGDDRALDGVQWVIDGQPYSLGQLRDVFYEPGLLGKLLGYNDEPLRAVPPLADIEAPPIVHLEGPTSTGALIVRIEERGAGFGGLFVTLNGSDVSRAVEQACPELAGGQPCSVQLADLPTWMPGRDNRVRVEAIGARSILRSRGIDAMVEADGEPIDDPPDLWVLAVGSGDYRGEALDLRYSPRDAALLADALRVAGARGFGPDHTHVRVLSTLRGPGVHDVPSKESLDDAFAWLQGSDPLDTVIVYLSGHGLAYSDGDVDDYFYLLPDGGSLEDIRDPSLRALRTFSGQQLASSMTALPALKRVVILDTCAAGKVDQDLSASRAISSDAVRAHARSRERTGAWLLAGAAADQVSYEASRFGQGVLTYTLIEGMKGPALDDADLLMVSRWIAWAETQVPRHAAGIGGVQVPVTRRGSAEDFVLGELPPADRDAIRLNRVLPVVVSARVVGRGGRQDTLRCTDAIDARLRDAADRPEPPFVHWDSAPIAETWQITGTCAEERGGIAFEGFLTRTGEDGAVEEHALEVRGADVASAAQTVVQRAMSQVR